MTTTTTGKSTKGVATKAAEASVGEEKLYKFEELYKAYKKGKQEGFELRDEIYLKAFKDNLSSAFLVTDRIKSLLKEQEVDCYKVLIKTDGVKNFTLFFIVSEDKYCTVEFAKIYSFAADRIADIDSEVFELDFSFLPNSDSLDEEKLKVDNFLMIYNGENTKAR